MAITISSAAATAMADALVDLVDASSDAGNLVFYDGSTEIATCPFADSDAFGDAVAGVATAGTITDDTTAQAGTIDTFEIQNGAGTMVLEGSCGEASSDDITISSADISLNDTVSVSSLTVTMPTS